MYSHTVSGLTCTIMHCSVVNAHRLKPEGHARRRTDALVYTPVDPSACSDYEYRTEDGPVSPDNFIMQGLSRTMEIATQVHSLKNSESFYGGIDGNPLANLIAYAEGEEVCVLSQEWSGFVLHMAICTSKSIQLELKQRIQFDKIQQD
ncbi:hypothetical protein DOTSEDRAFT_34354 [Dothistroma septosporum NZE10]|uniref:Uncharacterized protein n=1 Tax=Dothistroma septosporum (strain NZE10 / CBS 128990) TaxID=675120 RepID=N1PKA9_DOTSN|nr:hypothetical protein DOTSEDRAFT_34354 [Dothistroma septosporum NZE10]